MCAAAPLGREASTRLSPSLHPTPAPQRERKENGKTLTPFSLSLSPIQNPRNASTTRRTWSASSSTPGATTGSVSYLVEIDGKKFCFSGDVIYGPGQISDFHSLQKGYKTGDYHAFLGNLPNLKLSLDKLKNSHVGPLFLLDELYRAMPDKVWLTRFKEGGGKAQLSGVGATEEDVALFMRNIESSKSYEGVELQVTKQTVQDRIKFQQFDLDVRTISRNPDKKK